MYVLLSMREKNSQLAKIRNAIVKFVEIIHQIIFALRCIILLIFYFKVSVIKNVELY